MGTENTPTTETTNKVEKQLADFTSAAGDKMDEVKDKMALPEPTLGEKIGNNIDAAKDATGSKFGQGKAAVMGAKDAAGAKLAETRDKAADAIKPNKVEEAPAAEPTFAGKIGDKFNDAKTAVGLGPK